MTLAIYDWEIFGEKTFQFTQVDLVPSSFTWPSAPSLATKPIQSLLVAQPCLAFVCWETNPETPSELLPFYMEAILVLEPHESSQGNRYLHWVLKSLPRAPSLSWTHCHLLLASYLRTLASFGFILLQRDVLSSFIVYRHLPNPRVPAA